MRKRSWRKALLAGAIGCAGLALFGLQHLAAGSLQKPGVDAAAPAGTVAAGSPPLPSAPLAAAGSSPEPGSSPGATDPGAISSNLPVQPALEKLAPEKPALEKPAPDGAALDEMLVHRWANALYQNHRPRIRQEATPGPDIALTFDDGPKPFGTPAILSQLEKYQAHATFFLVGKQCARYPAIVSRIVADGDEIGNHTYSHYRLPTLPPNAVVQELERDRTLLRRLTGETTYLFRPPGGRTNPQIQTMVDSLGYTTVFWRLDSGELQKVMDPDRVYHRVVDHIQNGDIVLLHNGDANIVRALPRILENLTQRGFHCLTVSELMQAAGVRPNSEPPAPGEEPQAGEDHTSTE